MPMIKYQQRFLNPLHFHYLYVSRSDALLQVCTLTFGSSQYTIH